MRLPRCLDRPVLPKWLSYVSPEPQVMAFNHRQLMINNIAPCTVNPCLNGGNCFNISNVATCNCTGGFSGSICNIAPNPCTVNPCLNGGVCTNNNGTAACACQGAWTGQFCQNGSRMFLLNSYEKQPQATNDQMQQQRSPLHC